MGREFLTDSQALAISENEGFGLPHRTEPISQNNRGRVPEQSAFTPTEELEITVIYTDGNDRTREPLGLEIMRLETDGVTIIGHKVSNPPVVYQESPSQTPEF